MANSASGESILVRFIKIIQAFDQDHPALSATQLSRRSKIPSSTAHRLLQELTDLRLLTKDEDQRYRIGSHMWELATRSTPVLDLQSIARPLLTDLQEATNHHVSLGIREGDEVLYIERMTSSISTVNITQIAGRLPLHATSAGLALMAHAPNQEIDAFLARPKKTFTASTITDSNEMRGELAAIRQRGYAIQTGVIVPESTGVAAPIFDRNRHAIAAITVIIPRGEENLHAIIPALITAARTLTRIYTQGPNQLTTP